MDEHAGVLACGARKKPGARPGRKNDCRQMHDAVAWVLARGVWCAVKPAANIATAVVAGNHMFM
jgi:hypothetical protein